jgi:hypothetical protein
MLLYSVTIFLSAFLLFEVQPVIAKIILPWFGGTSAVWSTCMLFFQLVLLLGYLYAHWLHRAFRPRRQALFHFGLLTASIAALPILPGPSWKSAGVANPSLRILALLAVTVGLPYFLLSSTSPLLQAWYARNHKEGMPYRLFALSNFASMLALLSYPLLVEPNLPTRTQAWIWSGTYVAFAAVCAITGWRSAIHPAAAFDDSAAASTAGSAAPSWRQRLLWLALAGSASILLLAVTNHLTQDVAAIPFLWIAPLTAYLLSFILCFEAPRLYLRPLFLPLLILALAFMAFELWPGRSEAPILWVARLARIKLQAIIPAMTASLFVCCMVLHGELARSKPHPRYLTGFYVTVSLGGALGGLFVGLMAPNLFHAYYEFPIGLAITMVLVALVLAQTLAARRMLARLAATGALLLVAGTYLFCLGAIMRTMVTGYRVVARNFYGQLRVYDSGDPRIEEDASRKLVHGVINHGEQMLREEYRRMPVTYFCADSGIGRVMRATEGWPRRIGILGLGCGTLAAYGRAGDTFRIYEINPLVLDIARREFTYLSDTPAKVETATGDGRLVLESEPDQQFDLLVMDAFSGDSVPVHLITREAFKTYFRHLKKPGGILAVNISNKYLNLEPVMERASEAFDKVGLVYHYEPTEAEPFCFGCSWTLIMNRGAADAHPELLSSVKVLRPERPFRIWTDDFSNMFGILK